MPTKDSHPDRHFERRRRAARAGLHLPSEAELLLGMDFLGEDIRDDIREHAERLARRVKRRLPHPGLTALAAALDDLAVEQSEDAVASLQAALEAAEGSGTSRSTRRGSDAASTAPPSAIPRRRARSPVKPRRWRCMRATPGAAVSCRARWPGP